MVKSIIFAPQAREEVNTAARRYGEERPELRVEFHAAIKEALERMVQLSRHLGTPPLVDPEPGTRRQARVRGAVPVLGVFHRAAKPVPRTRRGARSPHAVLLA